jgi:all-trans-retinol dehydrogenase (NAD+)
VCYAPPRPLTLRLAYDYVYLASNAFFYDVDITSSASIEKGAQRIRQEHGEPTVLVNNAGIATLSTIIEESEAQIRRVFEVNSISHFLLVKEFLPEMVKRNHGHIITVASLSSYVTVAQNVDYCCTKAGALAFHEGLTQELRFRYNARKVRTR